MNGIVNIANFTVDSPDKFWIQNPQLVFMKPFSAFYKADTSKDKHISSRWMWYCHFMKCPYDKENLYYRMELHLREATLREALLDGYDLDLDGEMAFEECFDQYPNICLSTIERQFADILAEIEKIKAKITKTDITYDTTQIERNEKTGAPVSVTIKGNSKEYIGLLKAIDPLTKQFRNIYEELVLEKSKTQTYGQEQINKGEDDSW